MNDDLPRITRISSKLTACWSANPDLRFGQLLEFIENVSWRELEKAHQREFSARWLYLPDEFLEKGLDIWMKENIIAINI